MPGQWIQCASLDGVKRGTGGKPKDVGTCCTHPPFWCITGYIVAHYKGDIYPCGPHGGCSYVSFYVDPYFPAPFATGNTLPPPFPYTFDITVSALGGPCTGADPGVTFSWTATDTGGGWVVIYSDATIIVWAFILTRTYPANDPTPCVPPAGPGDCCINAEFDSPPPTLDIGCGLSFTLFTSPSEAGFF